MYSFHIFITHFIFYSVNRVPILLASRRSYISLSTSSHRLIELIYCSICSGYDCRSRWPAYFFPCSYISCGWCSLYQRCSVLLCQVFHLLDQPHIRSNSLYSLFLLPLQNVLNFQSGSILFDFFAVHKFSTLTYVIQGE